MDRRILAVGSLGAVESLLRVVFYYEGAFAGVQLLEPMPPPSTMNVVNPINLLLGLGGLVFGAGRRRSTGWGCWGTVAISGATIAFDGVSSVTVAFTAFAGLVLPVLFLLDLIRGRATYFASTAGESR